MNKKILIIDDDKDLTRAFQVMFENNGFDVVVASNGTEGWDKLKIEKPDIMILDVMMTSDLEGYTMLHRIKKEPTMKSLPIILLTGMIDAMGVNLMTGVEDEEMLPNVLFRDKPIEPKALLELIKDMTK